MYIGYTGYNQPTFTYPKSIMKTQEQCLKSAEVNNKGRKTSMTSINFEQISDIALVFPVLTLNELIPPGIGVLLANTGIQKTS